MPRSRGGLVPDVARALPDDESDEFVLEALEEHHAAKSMLAEIDRLSSDHERFRAKVIVLIESVEHHIDEEESTVFPELRRAMSRHSSPSWGGAGRGEAKTLQPGRTRMFPTSHPASPGGSGARGRRPGTGHHRRGSAPHLRLRARPPFRNQIWK